MINLYESNLLSYLRDKHVKGKIEHGIVSISNFLPHISTLFDSPQKLQKL